MAEAMTDGLGEVTVAMVPEPISALRAETEDLDRGQCRALYLRPGGVSAVEIKLKSKMRTARVRYAAEPGAVGLPDSISVRFLSGVSDWIQVPLGGVGVDVALPGGGPIRATVSLGALGSLARRWSSYAEAVRDGQLTLVIPTLSALHLELRGLGGEALPSLKLQLARLDAGGEPMKTGVRVARSNEDGVVDFSGLMPGQFELTAPGGTHKRVAVQPGLARDTWVLRGFSIVSGTYAGPAKVGGKPIHLEVRRPDGAELQEGTQRTPLRRSKWSLAVAAPEGTPLVLQATLGGQHLSSPVTVNAGESNIAVDLDSAILEVRPRRGELRRLRGWLSLRQLGEAAPAFEFRSFIDPRTGVMPCPRPPPGRYVVTWSADPWGQEVVSQAIEVSIASDVRTLDLHFD